MKKAPVFLLCAGFLLAFFLLGRGLVSGPETEQARQDPTVQETVFLTARVPERGAESTPSAEEHRDAREEAVRAETAVPAAPLCVCDRNGMPLTGRTWQKTVYLVCPPEGVPG